MVKTAKTTENRLQVVATITNFPEITLIYDVTDEQVVYKQGSAWVDSIHYVGNDKLHVAKLRTNTKGQYFLVQGTKYYLNTAIRNV